VKPTRATLHILTVVIENLLVASIIYSGCLTYLAGLIAIISLWSGGTIYTSGYFGYSLTEIPLLVVLNISLQYICVRGAARTLSPTLAKRQGFVCLLWKKTFFHGIPLLLLVFLRECINAQIFSPFALLGTSLVWFSYCYVVSLLLGRNYLRARDILINRKCPHCRYWLRGTTTNRCPECGWDGLHWPRIDRWGWITASSRFLRRIGLVFLALVMLSCFGWSLIPLFLTPPPTYPIPPPASQPQAPQTYAQASQPALQGAVIAGIIMNEDASLADAVVYLKKGLGGKQYLAPTRPLRFDIRDGSYFPHVLGIQAGQPIQVCNCSGMARSLNLTAVRNPESIWNMTTGMRFQRVFKLPELGIRATDSSSSLMSGYICVFDHPFFNVTDGKGVFRFEGLPAGTYVVESWHESLSTRQQQVTVKDGEISWIEIRY